MKNKKNKFFGIFVDNFETFVRYSWVADKVRKTGLRCVKGQLLF